jgi:hypothetical protein
MRQRDGLHRRRTHREEKLMGKIVSNFFISLVGVVESPEQWHFPYLNDEMGAAIGGARRRPPRSSWDVCSTTIGRRTGPRVTSRSHRSSTTFRSTSCRNSLTDAIWKNTTIISGNVASEIKDLKARTDGTIGITGSATVVRWILAEGLLDELKLTIHPIAVGRGQRLFEDTPKHPLHLVKHEVFSTGVLHVTYAPAGD